VIGPAGSVRGCVLGIPLDKSGHLLANRLDGSSQPPLLTATRVRVWRLVGAEKGVARPLPSRSSIEAETPARHQAVFIQVALRPTLGASMSPEELGQGTLLKLSFRNG